MPKQLDPETLQGARNALAGLSGALAKQEAQNWATMTGLHLNTIYAATKGVRPPRQPRADRGKRLADINHPMVRFAMEAVLHRGRLAPDLAIEQAEMQPEFAGRKFPVSRGTFLRYLREHGIDRAQRRASRVVRPHRRFEAEKPMDLYQFDISGLKKRWYYDVTSRRILKVSELEVSENHPNENPNRQQLWSFHLVDDHSRLYYLRFVPCLKPNATHVINFLWAAFRELGIPRVLYTDNDPIIVCAKMRNAAAVLDRYFEQLGLGGFKMEQHLPGNPNATGKVEAGHKIMAKYWNLLGARFRPPTFDDIENIAIDGCARHNWDTHSETGEMPMLRFRRSHEPMRLPPPVVLDSAFTADRLRLSITAAVTISVNNVEYQLPRSEMVRGPGGTGVPPVDQSAIGNRQSAMVPNPFLNRAGKRGDVHKINVVWPPDVDYFLVVADGFPVVPDGTVFEIPRMVAIADAAGEYKVTAETIGQKTWKTLEASAKERKRAFRATKRELDKDLREGFIDATEHRRLVAEADLRVPLIDGPAIAASSGISNLESENAASAMGSVPGAVATGLPSPVGRGLGEGDRLAVMPRKRIETDPALVAAAGGNVPPSMLDGRPIDYWTALGQLKSEGLITASEFDKAWLKSLFNGREEINDRELRDALSARVSSPTVREGVA